MPLNPTEFTIHSLHPMARVTIALSLGVLLQAGRPAAGQVQAPIPIRSRHAELHYRLADAVEGSRAALWYTRDRGATWQRCGLDEDGVSPMLFAAPAEGLYGISLSIQEPGGQPAPPAANEPPQRWVFVDATPPLVQWDSVEPAETFATRRVAQLRWTAYDDHLTARPVSLSYQSSVTGSWQPIEPAMLNTGRYDWTLPPEATGQISLKLSVSDAAGHVVERVHGPFPVERWMKTAAPPAPTTRPAAVVSTRPAESVGPFAAGPNGAPPPAAIDIEKQLKALDLHRQGVWQLQRGQHAIAAERFREALEQDPDLLAAQCDLAGIYYLQQDYGKAAELYGHVLSRDAKNAAALRGSALAYVATKQYALSRDMLKRLLTVNGKDAQAWLDLGDVVFMMGEANEARNHWSQATTADAAAEQVVRKARRRLDLYGTGLPDAPQATGNP